ncbi:MAG: hypothetical protein HOE92_07540 [Euryarchaeota archaeon]|jgi:hypothetical protein|nr:hypothetical protein [Euryarchaeota archaeon]MBT3972053.1 hypothetical protein [Euryarchaeota archaeon]MBT4407055.1 hypothetical protein [Euryarchaeota archaeon]MBT6644360.1 hypothetical protein [Euryarchaeota archaeon]
MAGEKKNNNSRKTTSALIVFSLSLLLFTPLTSGYSGGNGLSADGSGGDGCTCHGVVSDSSVIPAITLVGGAQEIVAGSTYTLEISLTGGPAVGGSNSGGFLLDVNSGEIASADDNTLVNGAGDEATHSTSGNDQRTWQINWTADSTDDAQFNLRVNSVNGDGQMTDDDDWNMATFFLHADGSIDQTAIEGEARLDVPDWTQDAIILGSVSLMIILTYLGFINKKGRGRRGEY